VRLNEKLLSGFRSYAGARLLTQGISWVGTVYIVRRLDSHAFGLFGIAMVLVSFGSILYDGTLTETLVQRHPADRSERRSVFTLLLLIGVCSAALMCGLGSVVSHATDEPQAAPLLWVMSCSLVLMSVTVLPHSRLIRDMAFPRLAIVSSVQALAATLTSVVLAYRGAGPWALVLGTLMGTAVRAVGLNVLAPSLTVPSFALTHALSYVRFGGTLLADNLLWRWYVSLDTLLLARWVGAASLGHYSLAQQLAEMPLEKISTIANDVALPAYTQLRQDEKGFARLMLETIRTHAIMGIPIFWGLAATADVAVPALFGPAWNAAIPPLMALAAVAPLRLIGSVETPAMTGLGRPGVLIQTKLIIVPAMTLALVIGAWTGGINGAALAWLLAFPICYGMGFRLVLRAATLPYGDVARVVRGPAGAGAIMFGVVRGWQLQSRGTDLPALAVLATSVVIGAIAYGVGLWLLDRQAFRLARGRAGQLLGLAASE